jgi:hypothetical protein
MPIHFTTEAQRKTKTNERTLPNMPGVNRENLEVDEKLNRAAGEPRIRK